MEYDKNKDGNKKAERAKDLLKNSSGIGTKLNMIDPQVLAEFAAAHPSLLFSDDKGLELASEIIDDNDSDNKSTFDAPIKEETITETKKSR